MCHILFVLPVISLALFLFLPFEQASLFYFLILMICSALYWVIWKDMRRPAATGIEGMIGGIGRVIESGKRTAKIIYKGEIWGAVCAEDVSVGESVQITGLERMKLLVRKKSHVSGTSAVREF